MKKDFEILFHEKLEENESMKQQFEEVESQEMEMKSQFEVKEAEMKERWKKDVDKITSENHDIEEAWKDLKDQENEYDKCLESDQLTVRERQDIIIEKEQLAEAKKMLKLEEEKVAAKQRKILDAIEIEMDRWEQHKKDEERKTNNLKKEIAKQLGNREINSLNSKIEEAEDNIEGMVSDLKKQAVVIKEFEKEIELKKVKFVEEKEELLKEKEHLNDVQCKAVIKLEKEIIAINEELNAIEEKMNEDLKEIQEERER